MWASNGSGLGCGGVFNVALKMLEKIKFAFLRARWPITFWSRWNLGETQRKIFLIAQICFQRTFKWMRSMIYVSQIMWMWNQRWLEFWSVYLNVILNNFIQISSCIEKTYHESVSEYWQIQITVEHGRIEKLTVALICMYSLHWTPILINVEAYKQISVSLFTQITLISIF